MKHGWLADQRGEWCKGKVGVVRLVFGNVEVISIGHFGCVLVGKQ